MKRLIENIIYILVFSLFIVAVTCGVFSCTRDTGMRTWGEPAISLEREIITTGEARLPEISADNILVVHIIENAGRGMRPILHMMPGTALLLFSAFSNYHRYRTVRLRRNLHSDAQGIIFYIEHQDGKK